MSAAYLSTGSMVLMMPGTKLHEVKKSSPFSSMT